MNDLVTTLRLRADANGMIRVLDQATGEVREFGTEGERSGKKAAAGLNRTERASKKLNASLGRVATAAGAALAGVISIRGGAAALRAITSATIEQERVQAQLAARIESTNGAAGRSVDQLLANASALQSVTTFGDEATLAMQGVLLTFTQIRDTQFDRATRSIQDVATVMGTDLQSAALQVGKALNDPIRGLDGLNRAGIQFSDAQKEVIKESGRDRPRRRGAAAGARRARNAVRRRGRGGPQHLWRGAAGAAECVRRPAGIPGRSAGAGGGRRIDHRSAERSGVCSTACRKGWARCWAIPPALEAVTAAASGGLSSPDALAENWEIIRRCAQAGRRR